MKKSEKKIIKKSSRKKENTSTHLASLPSRISSGGMNAIVP